ncbi:methylated-DNA--[protein]-cysteine S-methyltransferase [Brevibacterium sp. UCMA 11754]|uniref:methylated-DNA--[protein]-cysteine S-methyltransferase n=1 Tax=Brevibacterium sp. UCMA 11754 TaxID=2749198 RepID=UPI001F47988E|nr:methylated-DNA--[protein]-cysteine S-methyltransferase [Brevibacterium sp. UCMA 11754]MCF2572260.1 methylated-DNA--[protein]-cysteine S-methyltransferase [Brevibacterium sp. UCMA 11754]
MSSHEFHAEDDSSQATTGTPVGPITVTSNGRSITRVTWRETDTESGQLDDTGLGTAGPDVDHTDPLLGEALRQLRAYFDGTLTTFDLPLDLGQISATARTVLTTLDETVEPGTTVTYGELARRSGTGIPARAIGSIMGLNPLPLVIPCHRVVASDGLGGYSGGRRGEGLATKRWLLEFEDALPRPLF